MYALRCKRARTNYSERALGKILEARLNCSHFVLHFVRSVRAVPSLRNGGNPVGIVRQWYESISIRSLGGRMILGEKEIRRRGVFRPRIFSSENLNKTWILEVSAKAAYDLSV